MSGWVGWRVDGATLCFAHADAEIAAGYLAASPGFTCAAGDSSDRDDHTDGGKAAVFLEGDGYVPLCLGHAKDAAITDGWLVPLLDTDGFSEADRTCVTCGTVMA